MKRVLSTLFLLFAMQSPTLAQMFGKEHIIDSLNLSSSQIIEKANRWIIGQFNNYQAVFQYKDTTTIAVNGSVGIVVPGYIRGYDKDVPETYKFNMVIDAKPGKARLIINNFRPILPIADNTLELLLTMEVYLKSIENAGGSKQKKIKRSTIVKNRFYELEKFVKEQCSQLESFLRNGGDW